MKLFFPLAILLFANLTLVAQSVTTDELRARAKSLKIHKEVIVGYDKFKDRSGVSTKLFTNSMKGGVITPMSGIGLSAAFSFEGSKLEKKPDTFQIIITSGTNGPNDPVGRDRTAYFLIDGERLQLKPVSRDHYISGQFAIQALEYSIGREDLEKLSTAKLAELRIGEETITLKKELLDRLGKLLRLIDQN